MSDPDNSKDILKNIWPQERDTMTRPDRIRYVRQLKSKSDQCVFCEALSTNVFSYETLLLHKTKHSMVILNKYPYNTGHILVLPLRHEGQLDAFSAEEIADMALTVQKCVGILKKEYTCQGLNIGLNHGDVAGAGIPDHLHWHIIPRWFGDTNFFPLIAETKVQVETLETTFKRLKSYF
jgi:ATP adenylyltransferase